MLVTLWSLPAVSFFLPTYSKLLRQNRRVIGVMSALVAAHLFSLFVRRICALWATGLCEQLVLDSLYMILKDVLYAWMHAALYLFFGTTVMSIPISRSLFSLSMSMSTDLLRSITRPSREG
jgi:hypothetical protein